MENGHAKDPEIIVPDTLKEAFTLMCHRFFAPVVIPMQDRVVPNKMNFTASLGNFPCLREKCTMWNSTAGECWDVSAAKGQALAGELAYAKLNDVHLDAGGK